MKNENDEKPNNHSSCSKNHVEIKSSDIFWKVYPIVIGKNGKNVLVQLQWGWTAGMTEEDLERYADDAPRGYDCVTTTLDMAKELRDELDEIIEKHKDELIQ